MKRVFVQISAGSKRKSRRAGEQAEPGRWHENLYPLLLGHDERLDEGTRVRRLQFQVVSGPRSRPYSLLITDDDDAFRETLRSIFEPEGFRTLLAHSGEEALDILRDQQVHLALLDQNMPRLTGLETLRIIRQMNSMLPVILLTADSTQQLLRDALAAQAYCVMSKPVTRHVVVCTVYQALSRSYDPASGDGILGGGQREEPF